jgi:ADP-ribose pyrophosphatase
VTDRLAEETIDRELIHSGYLTFRLDTVRDATGKEHRREIVEHPGAIAVLALDGDHLLMVRQFRAAIGQVLLEIPAGTRDRTDDGMEDPDRTAVRELEEETGKRAGSWRKLGTFYTAPGFATEEMHLYLAHDLEDVEGYDGPMADERLEVVAVPWRTAVSLVERGEIRDAKTMVGVLWLDRLMREGASER